MVGSTRGIVTVATGHPRYLEMAVDLALSARDHTSLPIALATDAALEARVRDAYPDVFDDVARLSGDYLFRRAAKYGVAEASPWEHTLFIDADCWVIHDPEPLLAAVEKDGASGMLVHGEFFDASTDKEHHGFPVGYLMRRYGVERYLKCNSGVFAFRREAALPMMRAAFELYRDRLVPELRGGFLGDELGIGLTGAVSGMEVFEGAGPMFWRDELETLDLATAHKPIVHMIGRIRSAAFDQLTTASRERRRRAGIQDVGSGHWAWKQWKTRKSVWVGNLLKPLAPLGRLLRVRRLD